ncbi:MAG: hypothetical protein IKB08_08105 [Clostridia bacterium]|nr:hypothetical protein [Clostridia bacterium]
MNFLAEVTAFFLSVVYFFLVPLFSVFPCYNDYSFEIDASQTGDTLPNAVSNINRWNMNDGLFVDPEANPDNNIFEFVEYVQFMQCTGGSADRDLFKDPFDFDTLDDYDFTSLIENCKGVLKMGAKPHLKTGSVPLKYSALARTDTTFGTNPYPPDDYDVYYDYIYAIGEALVNEFGAEEVLTWRFGVMTEYENKDWFFTADEDPENSAAAYCKLYDYTVDALQKSIGEEVFVGAHSMTVTEGLWDEKIFIEHCAKGTNYKTGETGTRLCFLSASFYDSKPGEPTSGKTVPECIEYLRSCADEAGLKDLIFGFDEGRLYGSDNSGADDSQLLSRTVGYTYQAAYDARLYNQLISAGGDYFSSWEYLSNNIFDGNPTVSYHVAKNVAKFKGMTEISSKIADKGLLLLSDVDCLSAIDEKDGSMLIMAYNFMDDVSYKYGTDMEFNISAPHLDGKQVNITVSRIDDSCNYFDEWVKDRETYGIGNDCFGWSPDCPVIENYANLRDENARNIYFSLLKDKYKECSVLTPESITATVHNGTLTLTQPLAPNGVLFIEITPVQ